MTWNKAWSVLLTEIDTFFGLNCTCMVWSALALHLWAACGVPNGDALFSIRPYGQTSFPVNYDVFEIWHQVWKKRRLGGDQFALASSIWYPFIENCQRAFFYLTVMSLWTNNSFRTYKARRKFIQYISTKPDKFRIKFWLAANVANEYVCNGFPYTGRDENRAQYSCVATDSVMKLISSLFNKGYHVTCDNYITSVPLTKKLL